MSILFLESFDGIDPLPGKRNVHGAGASSVTARTGARGFDATANTNIEYLRKTLTFGGHATFIAGAGCRWTGTYDAGTSNGIFRFTGDTDTTQHLTLMVETGGALVVRRGNGAGTILGSSALGVMPINTYVYVEMKATLHDTTGSVDLQVNGVNVLSLTNVDTKNGGAGAVFDGFRICKARCFVDDIYVANGDGPRNIDFLGDCQVAFKVPTSDGVVQWTPSVVGSHWPLVDEVGPNTTDYVASDVAGDVDMFGFPAISTGLAVLGVQVSSYASKDAAGPRNLRHRVNSAGIIATGIDHAPAVIPSYLTFAHVFNDDPDGGGAWTAAKVNAATFGVETRP